MKKIVFALALFAATPVMAAEVTIKLNDQEQQQLIALLDLAVKQGGINVAGAVTYFANKIKNPAPEAPAPAKK